MSGIGIDFGTTNSVAAEFDSSTGRIRALTDPTTNQPHPSVVWFQGERVIVGHKAKQNIEHFAEVSGNHFERSIKRALGHDRAVSVFGEHKATHQIAAEVFRFLRQQAEEDYRVKVEEA